MLSETKSFGVRCTTAGGEDVLVTVDATNEPDAMGQVAKHIRMFYGPGDGAGRWLASQNPDTLKTVHEAKPIEEWEAVSEATWTCADCDTDVPRSTNPEAHERDCEGGRL